MTSINWFEIHPELRGKVKNQRFTLCCWAIAIAFVIGVRYFLTMSCKSLRWLLSAQDLIDNLIRFYPDEIPRQNGKIIMGHNNTYPAYETTAFEYCKRHGLAYECDYPYTGTRDTSSSQKPIKSRRRRVYIRDYTLLGCSTDGPEEKLNIFHAVCRGPVIGTVLADPNFLDWEGDKVIEPEINVQVGVHNEINVEEHVEEHVVAVVGMDTDVDIYDIQNSYGLKWGVEGVGSIKCGLVYDIFEPLDPSSSPHPIPEPPPLDPPPSPQPIPNSPLGSKAFKGTHHDKKPPGVRRTLFEVISQVKSSHSLQHQLQNCHALWTGLGAQLARDVPFGAICWRTLEPARRTLREESNLVGVQGVNFSAGALAVAATYPLDVAKTRRQAEENWADTSQGALQVLDIVLVERPSARCYPVGRSFHYTHIGRRQPLGKGLESWRGFYLSKRPTQMGLSVNIANFPDADMSTVFIEPLPAIEFASQLLNRSVSFRPLLDADCPKKMPGGNVNIWMCVNFARNVQDNLASRFCYELAQMCTISGMRFNPDPVLLVTSALTEQVERLLKRSYQEVQTLKKELDLLIVILPDKNDSLYGGLKRIYETGIDIVSQCCLTKHVLNTRKLYLANVASKINVKVGGSNIVLVDTLSRSIPLVTDPPTIFFGADVTHHSGEHSIPPIAAVVASQDLPEITKYAGMVSAQAHSQKLIQDLYKIWQDPNRGTESGGMIKELLISFRRLTGQKSQRIIFFSYLLSILSVFWCTYAVFIMS